MRAERDQAGELWIPLEDIGLVRGKRLTLSQLLHRRLVPGADFRLVDPDAGDELVTRLWPDPRADGRIQIIVSESGLRRLLIMPGSSADRSLQDWITDQSLPAPPHSPAASPRAATQLAAVRSVDQGELRLERARRGQHGPARWWVRR